MTNEILLQDLTTTWTLLANGYGTYINNGAANVYVQRNPDAAPAALDEGLLISQYGSFFVTPEEESKTYVRSATATAKIAKI